MAEWAKAAEEQLSLHRWLLSPGGNRWLREWIGGEKAVERAKGDMYQMLALGEPQKLLTADSIWVERDMSDLIEVAREDFKAEPFLHEDMLVHTGFCYFEKPLVVPDRNGMVNAIGAFSWCPFRVTADDVPKIREDATNVEIEESGSEIISYGAKVNEDLKGIALTLYASTVDERDDYHVSMRAIRGEYGAGELVPLHFTPVFFGSALEDGDMYDEQGRYTGADHWWRTVQVTLRLMQQHITIRTDAQTPRATRRRWEREGKTPPKDICVIQLRRATPKRDDSEPGESGRHLTHRHFREGHWRRQWYPSLGVHRQIRIQRTIVGDASLPLIIKRRFYKWDR